jgi:predicted ATP-grasp superfamily ATP-dependent carboligase
MNAHSTNLMGKKIGVIGFNARPLAASLLRSGAEVYASDYWGDSDLSSSSTDCIAVLSPLPGMRQRQPLDVPLPEALVENFLLLTKNIQIDFVMIGSGFDDDADALKPLTRESTLLGNSIKTIQGARDFSKIDRIAKRVGVNRPKEFITSTDSVHDDIEMIGYPCLLRPIKSGGGRGIRFIRNSTDLDRYAQRYLEEKRPFRLQEYIHGLDLSTSVLGSKDGSVCISVQGQLIGMPSAGLNCGFTYCGNYFPAPLNEQTYRHLADISEMLCTQLHLIGSNGFDFIRNSKGESWLSEVNPRIQGTLEMLESASSLSVSSAHISAIEGILPSERPVIMPVTKMVVYSRKTGKVPILSSYPNAFDLSPAGVIVRRGDPICTLIKVSESLDESYSKVSEAAARIQNSVI